MDTNNESYVTVKELSAKIKFSKQTIYNMIHQKIFVKGQHYIKPRPKKILFIWSAVLVWLESPEEASIKTQKPPCKEPIIINQGCINI